MRPVPTPSERRPGAADGAGTGVLRARRAEMLATPSIAGAAFGVVLAGALDEALEELVSAARPAVADGVPVAIVALGSYARRELCPGSDVDVLLLVGRGRRRGNGQRARTAAALLSEHLWYPLWDAGFVLGHATRSVRDTLALAERDLDVLTALLEARHVAGDAALTEELVTGARVVAPRRFASVVDSLAADAVRRRHRPGPIAEVLEPDLKEGAGGLRDLQALEWAGWALGAPGGLRTLEERGYLSVDDAARLVEARPVLLEARVGLHRTTGGRSDRLTLEDHDAVAEALGDPDADVLVGRLAATAREVAWISADVWSRLRAARSGPGGRAGADRLLAHHVVLRDGRVTLVAGAPVTSLTVLELGAAAAAADAPVDRAALDRLREMPDPQWDVWERAAFLRLLRAGRPAVAVFEALDHVGVLSRLLPEWELVRSRPQRNSYHRFTVDRHLLETVAECARLLDAGDDGAGGPSGRVPEHPADQVSTVARPDFDLDGVVARACRRPELLLLAGLLHDVGKGIPGPDHAGRGAEAAREITRRMRFDSEAVEVVPWLVRDHLLLADTATRRDLSDEQTVMRFAAPCVGDPERLRLLYLLTIADSRATGPAAWGTAKAALARDLFVKAAAVVGADSTEPVDESRRRALAARLGEEVAAAHLATLPPSYVLAFDAPTMEHHQALLAGRGPAVECRIGPGESVSVTVVAPDQRGLLATVAGALTVCGLSVREASLFTSTEGMAVDTFRAVDPFSRVERDGLRPVEETLRRALAGELDVEPAVRERMRNYRRDDRRRGPVEVTTDLEASEGATVVEVHADDQVGLLHRLARAFARLDLEVTLAKVATLGERVVDVFYVRDARGAKVTDPEVLARLSAELVEAGSEQTRPGGQAT